MVFILFNRKSCCYSNSKTPHIRWFTTTPFERFDVLFNARTPENKFYMGTVSENEFFFLRGHNII